ncbi:Hypothetical protein DIP0094 [Corynebacterium diphtheriae]|uniref:Uncharacterized protein n=1 Tax=Corynebacterium diphtheriae (strain ATCC 700971 / NCTC 13129 / Biotype gravis) TaxID=257309 RepID=Q6NKD8_CORDI|nr:Hypothetical protein DIP0094 [Corynebacterium diphtheriae]
MYKIPRGDVGIVIQQSPTQHWPLNRVVIFQFLRFLESK